MGKYIRLLCCAAVVSAVITGCKAGHAAPGGNEQTTEQVGKQTEEQTEEALPGSGGEESTAVWDETDETDEILSSAPAIRLTDMLSSTINGFEVTSGNYDWNYRDGDQMAGVKACGSHPLYEAKGKERMKLPKYNRMDYVCYGISCEKHPDRMTVNEYSMDAMENTDAKPVSSRVYEGTIMLELKAGYIYELVAQWDEENLDTNGFFGTAGYVIVTE